MEWTRCLVEERPRKAVADRMLTPILDFMSEHDRALFRELPDHLQERKDRIPVPKAMPNLQQKEHEAHVRRHQTPAKYRVIWIAVYSKFLCGQNIQSANS